MSGPGHQPLALEGAAAVVGREDARFPVDVARVSRLIDRACHALGGEALTMTLHELTDLLGARQAIGLLLESGARVRVASQPALLETQVDLASYPEVAEAMKGQQAVVVPLRAGAAAVAEPAGLGLLDGAGLITVVPLAVGHETLGVFVLRTDGPPDPGALATAMVLGQIGAGFFLRGLRTVGRERLATPSFGLVTTPVGGRRRLLVVEDDADIAEELLQALELEGYEVVAHRSGAAGLESARETRPDLVLLDVKLPDCDGFTVARELADDPRTAGVPILFLSAAEDLAARVRVLRSDESDFLPKPFLLKDLFTRVEQSILRADNRNRLLHSAHVDELTGLGNLRLFEERLAIEASRLNRYHTPLTLVVMDLDKLKTINDTHGHATGSAVLHAVGETLRKAVRETDLAARYGGDEFVVLLSHTDLAHGVAFAERLLGNIRALQPSGIAITCSLGVAAFDRMIDDSVQHLFERADQAAYRAKREGGDRLRVDEPHLNTVIVTAPS